MLSEKGYWTILIVAFSIFTLIIWLWLVPSGFLDYNLGENLLTSSIFMVLTVFFLSLLTDLRRKREWKSTKEQLHYELGSRLYSIFRQILFLVDNTQIGYMSKIDYTKKLSELSNMNNEEFWRILDLCFQSAKEEILRSLRYWTIRDKEFIVMELQNFQLFLNPHLRVHIVNILCYLVDTKYYTESRGKYMREETALKALSERLLAIVKEVAEIEKIEGGLYQESLRGESCDRIWFEQKS